MTVRCVGELSEIEVGGIRIGRAAQAPSARCRWGITCTSPGASAPHREQKRQLVVRRGLHLTTQHGQTVPLGEEPGKERRQPSTWPDRRSIRDGAASKRPRPPRIRSRSGTSPLRRGARSRGAGQRPALVHVSTGDLPQGGELVEARSSRDCQPEAQHIDHGEDGAQPGASGCRVSMSRIVRSDSPESSPSCCWCEAGFFPRCANRSADLGGDVLTCDHGGKILPKSVFLAPVCHARQDFGRMLPARQGCALSSAMNPRVGLQYRKDASECCGAGGCFDRARFRVPAAAQGSSRRAAPRGRAGLEGVPHQVHRAMRAAADGERPSALGGGRRVQAAGRRPVPRRPALRSAARVEAS